MKNIPALKKQLACMSTECALLCIIQKGAGTKQFIWGGQLWTPEQAKDKWEPHLLDTDCGEFGIIRFYGGPPKNGGWFNGTMLSMLCDLVLFDESTSHWSLSEKLSA